MATIYLCILMIHILPGLITPVYSRDGSVTESILTPTELFLLRNIEPVKVMFDDNYIPISNYNAASKKYEGIAVSVLENLSQALDFEYEIIHSPEIQWPDKLDKIKNNEISILGSASKNTERQEYGYFTDTPYFTINYALIKRVDNHVYIGSINDLNSNIKIGLSRGISINDFILSNLVNTESVQYFENQKAALEALKNREIDVYPYNEAVFKEEFFNGTLFDFEIAYSISEIRKEYSFFCPLNENGRILTEILEKGMQHVDVDKIISDRYQNKSNFAFYKSYLENLQKRNSYITVALVLLGALCLSGILILFILRKEGKQKQIIINQLELLKKELEKKAAHDSLTGLPNRRLFQDRIERIVARSKRDESRFALMFLDLDGFKDINDKYGHETGDKVLIKVSEILLKNIREEDTIARIGGDEFIILLNCIPDKKHPSLIAERVLESFNTIIEIEDKKCKIGISIGISIYPDDSQNINNLITLADNAMYTVKAENKNHYKYAGK